MQLSREGRYDISHKCAYHLYSYVVCHHSKSSESRIFHHFTKHIQFSNTSQFYLQKIHTPISMLF